MKFLIFVLSLLGIQAHCQERKIITYSLGCSELTPKSSMVVSDSLIQINGEYIAPDGALKIGRLIREYGGDQPEVIVGQTQLSWAICKNQINIIFGSEGRKKRTLGWMYHDGKFNLVYQKNH